MKKKHRNILIATASTIVAVVALLGVAAVLLNTPRVQQSLLQRATTLLAEKLNTHVEIDSISVNPYVPSMALYGLRIDDQQGGPLLRMGQLTAKVSVESVWERRFVIKQVKTDSLEATLVKAEGDSVTNFQFLIDAFKKDKTKEATEQKPKTEKKGTEKWGLAFHPKHLRMKDTHITSLMDGKKTDATIQKLDMKRKDKEYRFSIDGLLLNTDNGKPDKNAGKPKKEKRFDAGHLHLTANLQGTARLIGQDSISATLTETTIQDPETGIDISDLRLHADIVLSKTLTLTDIALKQGSTTLAIERAHITLPDTTKAQRLAYEVENITGQVVLQDIAQPFVHALKEFRLPLQLHTRLSGTDEEMTIPSIQVSTNDKRLTLTANGRISHLSGGQDPVINFNISQLRSKQGMAEKVINQFIVKKLMMNQLHQLGDISYKGNFNVALGCENFRGKLTTKAGDLNFHFTIDDHNGQLRGGFNSPAIKVGQVMDMPNIGDVDCQADFDIDISKQRTAKIRQQHGGKLPIGTVTAVINDCSYKRTHVRNININIQSDGANASGDILQLGNRRQITCSFIYNESDPKHKLRITDAGIHFGKTQEEKAEQQRIKQEKKGQKKQEKLEKKELKKQKNNN